MSIFGALYSGVSGLKSQGTSLGVISDNISNVSTVGYKKGDTQFETLVTNSPSSISYNPGGVLANVRSTNTLQGLLTATESPTDIAISGNGFFVVNERADSQATDASFLYTRAGSFRQDSLGNFVNAGGFFLQGWPLDREGRLPGELGNLNTTAFSTTQSLQTVNIENTSGVVAATTNVEIGANLDASEDVYQGAGSPIAFATQTANQGITADSIWVPTNPGAPVAGDALNPGRSLRVVTDAGLQYDYQYGGFEESDTAAVIDFTAAPGGNGVNITSAQDSFFSGTGPNAGDETMTITVSGVDYDFRYVQSSPNPFATIPEFNNLTTLANAINETTALTARVSGAVGAERIYVAPEDANLAMTFTNSGAVNWAATLGWADTVAAAGVQRFASYQGLADQINASDGISAILENPTGEAQMQIVTDDPLGTITFADDTQAGAPGTFGAPAYSPAATTYNLIQELSLYTDTDSSGALDIAAENVFGPIYDTSAAANNMAGGGITPQFTRNIRIFDSLGQGHDLTIGFIKIADNQWAVEVFAANADEVNGSLPGGENLLTFGTMTFNGDGSLRAVSGGLANPVNITWTNGALASSVSFDLGTAGFPAGTAGATTIGETDGVSQFASDYNVAFVIQNGAEVGSLVSVNIDEDGFVIANYSNGESQKLYQIPIADFSNPEGLEARSGNVWFDTEDAGEVNLRQARTNGQGKVVSGVLEASNVELAEELTDMIVTQRAYQSATKVISTSDELLKELTRL